MHSDQETMSPPRVGSSFLPPLLLRGDNSNAIRSHLLTPVVNSTAGSELHFNEAHCNASSIAKLSYQAVEDVL